MDNIDKIIEATKNTETHHCITECLKIAISLQNQKCKYYYIAKQCADALEKRLTL